MSKQIDTSGGKPALLAPILAESAEILSISTIFVARAGRSIAPTPGALVCKF
jgi:hypothetical protein